MCSLLDALRQRGLQADGLESGAQLQPSVGRQDPAARKGGVGSLGHVGDSPMAVEVFEACTRLTDQVGCLTTTPAWLTVLRQGRVLRTVEPLPEGSCLPGYTGMVGVLVGPDAVVRTLASPHHTWARHLVHAAPHLWAILKDPAPVPGSGLVAFRAVPLGPQQHYVGAVLDVDLPEPGAYALTEGGVPEDDVMEMMEDDDEDLSGASPLRFAYGRSDSAYRLW